MGYDEAGATVHRLMQGLLHEALVLSVKGAGGFI